MATSTTPGPSEPGQDSPAENQGDVEAAAEASAPAPTESESEQPAAASEDGTPAEATVDAAAPTEAAASEDGTPAEAAVDAAAPTEAAASEDGTPVDAAAPTEAAPETDRPTEPDTTADTNAANPAPKVATPKATPADLLAAVKQSIHPTPSASSATGAASEGAATTGDAETPAPSEVPAPSADSETVAVDEWGRVDVNGEVYVRTADGERHIGSWQVGEPDKALAFYRRKFDDLVVQVDLLEQRLSSGAATPDSTEQAIAKLSEAMVEPHAIGDLDSIRGRLAALRGQVSERRAERKAARAQELAEARTRKEHVADQAERIAESDDWRHGADRLRQHLDEWKSLPRLDRATDDALWRRFSTARTHYTRRRKAHFAELAERRDDAREIKEKILREAEGLATSTDWGDTARRFRDLMSQWKAAGPAPRSTDEALWKRFRAAQDTFFAARTETFAKRDTEHGENLAAKETLLTEAEALLPITNWKTAREVLRSIQDRWEAVGHVPRESMRSVESRLGKVEDAIRAAETSDWQRSNPEARARATDTVAQLRTSIADLETQAAKAREAGNERKAADAEEALAARRSWLEKAEETLDEFR